MSSAVGSRSSDGIVAAAAVIRGGRSGRDGFGQLGDPARTRAGERRPRSNFDYRMPIVDGAAVRCRNEHVEHEVVEGRELVNRHELKALSRRR